MDKHFEIKKGILGGYSITYECPACSARLKSSLDEAGKQDMCPECRKSFVVPGGEERERLRQEESDVKRRKQEHAVLVQRQRDKEVLDRAKLDAQLKQPNEIVQFTPAAAAKSPPRPVQLYEYFMVQIPPTIVVQQEKGNEAAVYLERVVNENARKGWEFYRIDEFVVRQNPGCLLIFSGVREAKFVYHVITFRRPTPK